VARGIEKRVSRHITQEVCPWNSPKLVQATSERDYLPRVPGLSGSRPDPDAGTGTHCHPHTHRGPATEAPSLVELMRMSYEEWDVWTRGSAIRRAGYAGFKRNVAVAIGNWLASVGEPPEEAVAVLREALGEEEPLVREHAAWGLEGSD
jgi:epoxyqueuosine reductase QueG